MGKPDSGLLILAVATMLMYSGGWLPPFIFTRTSTH